VEWTWVADGVRTMALPRQRMLGFRHFIQPALASFCPVHLRQECVSIATGEVDPGSLQVHGKRLIKTGAIHAPLCIALTKVPHLELDREWVVPGALVHVPLLCRSRMHVKR